MPLLPPSSSSDRPGGRRRSGPLPGPLAPSRWRRSAAMRRDAPGLPDVRPSADDQAEDGRRNSGISASTRRRRVACHGAQRRFFRGFPDHRVAADQGQHGVPGPDGHGEIEGRDHPDRPQRMPLLGQAVPGRSLGIVRPWSWRLRPTAKSHMSIISWTSPSASAVILPASQETSVGQVGLAPSQPQADPPDQLAPARGRNNAQAGKAAEPRRSRRRRHGHLGRRSAAPDGHPSSGRPRGADVAGPLRQLPQRDGHADRRSGRLKFFTPAPVAPDGLRRRRAGGRAGSAPASLLRRLLGEQLAFLGGHRADRQRPGLDLSPDLRKLDSPLLGCAVRLCAHSHMVLPARTYDRRN